MDPNQNPQQQPPQGYPPQQQQGYAPQQVTSSYPGKGLCIASLILGIGALVFSWLYGAGGLLAVVGLILGIVGKKKADEVGAPSGMGKAGIICSAITLAINVIVLIACVACIGALGVGAASW